MIADIAYRVRFSRSQGGAQTAAVRRAAEVFSGGRGAYQSFDEMFGCGRAPRRARAARYNTRVRHSGSEAQLCFSIGLLLSELKRFSSFCGATLRVGGDAVRIIL